ncbi:MAG: YfhO family protein [Chloroflexota bacterium]
MKLRRFFTPDVLAILFLIALWSLFFWRLFTPIQEDQTSLKKGDFSGQFVAFGAYQYERLTAGEVPLWNPYNNGGLPFLADTQAAVFYPPRLVTIGLSKLSGGWTYHALELEMTAHVLLYSLLMYLLVRRMTLSKVGSIFGALVAAVIASYGGFLTSYAPLQLALLEAGIWLPLAVLGVYEATRKETPRWTWLVMTGFVLGLSWMAGHPQSSFFLTYLLIAYFAYRAYEKHYSWKIFAAGTVLFGTISGGMAAVQLLPGFEYLLRTSRTEFGFDAKGNGFPFRDIIQFLFPNITSQWSPLYVGIPGLALAIIAVWRRLPGAIFWGIAALVALVVSFGANSPLFALLYNILPGLRFFRGQERAAYLVANILAILAGLGAVHLASWDSEQWPLATRNIRRALITLTGLCSGALVLVFNEWLNNHDLLNNTFSTVFLSVAIAAGTLVIVWLMMKNPQTVFYHWLLLGLIVFELFTVNMDTETNYDSVPPEQQLSFSPPPLVAQAVADKNIPFRVDGYRALNDNYGTFYDLDDIRGISPLFLDSAHAIIENGLINPRAWELFAVRYVYTDWAKLPVASTIIAKGDDRYGAVNMHLLSDPRPFAQMLYKITVADNDESARAILADSNFDPRHTIILQKAPDQAIANNGASDATATVKDFKPESFTIDVSTSSEGILSIANVDYPGWRATVDGQTSDILRAYGALQAVVVPAGEHTVRLVFDPISYHIGAILSIITWGALGLFGIVLLIRRRSHAGQ